MSVEDGTPDADGRWSHADGTPATDREAAGAIWGRGPQRFRKRPVEIEAQRYTDAQSGTEIIQRILDAGGSASLHCVDPDQRDHGGHTIRIRTLEGDMHASVGDWIIRGVQGDFYPCKPDIFAETYDPASEQFAIAVRVVMEGDDAGVTLGTFTLVVPEEFDVDHVRDVVSQAVSQGRLG